MSKYKIFSKIKSEFITPGFGICPKGILRCPAGSGGFTHVYDEFKVVWATELKDMEGKDIYEGY